MKIRPAPTYKKTELVDLRVKFGQLKNVVATSNPLSTIFQ